MTSTSRCGCGFVPPHVLRHIANAENVEGIDDSIRASAQNTLNHVLNFQTNRSSNRPHGRPAHTGIIPSFMLRNLAGSEAVDDESRASADQTLQHQLGAQAKKSIELKVKREVYNANYSDDPQNLPGKFVTSDAKPSAQAVEKTVTDCFNNLGAVYKFYADIFSRDSIDDKGLTLIGTVHYGKNYENAFWDSVGMRFGDGGKFLFNFTASLDVVGHELTHGVTEHTARLDYEGQAGALNESISDVFGSMIRQYSYKQTSDEADWLIGEDCILPDIKGLALRSMSAPGTAYDDPRIGKDPQGKDMKGYQDLPLDSDNDNGGVHVNSGIPNRAFYLVAKGLGGHSWEKAGPIWYNTISGKEINNKCNFKQFATITVDVAKSLYGNKEAQVVTDAWKTVGVLE